jgi:hypothetical protein
LAGHYLLRHAGQLPVLLISRACLRQVQLPADQGVATGGGEGQGDRHLAQRDPAQGTAVLAGRTDRIGCGLLIGGLVHDQHRVLVTQMADRPGRRRIEELPLVPDRPRQQMLQPVRT